jgi:hypothetical protein
MKLKKIVQEKAVVTSEQKTSQVKPVLGMRVKRRRADSEDEVVQKHASSFGVTLCPLMALPYSQLSTVWEVVSGGQLCKGSFAGKRGNLVASHRYFSRVRRITVTAQPKPKALGVGSAAAGDGD